MSMGDYDDSDWSRDMSGQKCDRCNGTGLQDCPFEYGDCGHSSCPACGGRNKVPCDHCNGSGRK